MKKPCERFLEKQTKNLKKQDKYTMDPGQSNLSQQYENNFWSKMTFEKKSKQDKVYNGPRDILFNEN